uniref:Transcription factor IIIB 90 kDa subunit (Trinotate prediction) n=1 Tax=Myxobolus squamalis TaxID=59785 RepID=A0A6B2FYX8_MYXSQ
MGKETENVCPCCGESNFETDIEGGFIVCTDCGTLIKENIIVAEVEFQDHGTSSRAVGKFVADEGQGCIGPGGMIQATNERSGASIAKARRNISMIANNPLINLPSNVVDAAVVYYKFALGGNLTRARCCSYIAVACLYIVCRLKQTSRMCMSTFLSNFNSFYHIT